LSCWRILARTTFFAVFLAAFLETLFTGLLAPFFAAFFAGYLGSFLAATFSAGGVGVSPVHPIREDPSDQVRANAVASGIAYLRRF
jgi:hypothetical protein